MLDPKKAGRDTTMTGHEGCSFYDMHRQETGQRRADPPFLNYCSKVINPSKARSAFLRTSAEMFGVFEPVGFIATVPGAALQRTQSFMAAMAGLDRAAEEEALYRQG